MTGSSYVVAWGQEIREEQAGVTRRKLLKVPDMFIAFVVVMVSWVYIDAQNCVL